MVWNAEPVLGLNDHFTTELYNSLVLISLFLPQGGLLMGWTDWLCCWLGLLPSGMS